MSTGMSFTGRPCRKCQLVVTVMLAPCATANRSSRHGIARVPASPFANASQWLPSHHGECQSSSRHRAVHAALVPRNLSPRNRPSQHPASGPQSPTQYVRAWGSTHRLHYRCSARAPAAVSWCQRRPTGFHVCTSYAPRVVRPTNPTSDQRNPACRLQHRLPPHGCPRRLHHSAPVLASWHLDNRRGCSVVAAPCLHHPASTAPLHPSPGL